MNYYNQPFHPDTEAIQRADRIYKQDVFELGDKVEVSGYDGKFIGYIVEKGVIPISERWIYPITIGLSHKVNIRYESIGYIKQS